MMIKMQFLIFFSPSLESAGSQLALGSPGMTDIAKEETFVQNVRASRLTMMFPGCSWVSSESGSSRQLALSLFSWISTLSRALHLTPQLFALIFPAKLPRSGLIAEVEGAHLDLSIMGLLTGTGTSRPLCILMASFDRYK